MYLKSVTYSEHEGDSRAWFLEGLSLGAKNLIVGKNASGKTRTLNIISSLAQHLAGIKPPSISGRFNVEFIDGEKVLKYELHFDDGNVIKERFSIEDTILLDRSERGEGNILAEEIDGGKDIRFQTPTNVLAAFSRRDAIQHTFLEPLFIWGDSLRHHKFGTPLGKDHLAIFTENKGNKLNERDPNNVVPLYREAIKKFGKSFMNTLIIDMGLLGYDIEDVDVAAPISIIVTSNLPGEMVTLNVKERELSCITDQFSMSQGMFRALSILIQINYSKMNKKAMCILIDDIGEGLDFDRSCKLINLLRDKIDGTDIQLVLSTNDRFVMNNVPLEEWSVIQRKGANVKVHNLENSRKSFEDFKFTGLSNFSFLEIDFLNEITEEFTPDE